MWCVVPVVGSFCSWSHSRKGSARHQTGPKLIAEEETRTMSASFSSHSERWQRAARVSKLRKAPGRKQKSSGAQHTSYERSLQGDGHCTTMREITVDWKQTMGLSSGKPQQNVLAHPSVRLEASTAENVRFSHFSALMRISFRSDFSPKPRDRFNWGLAEYIWSPVEMDREIQVLVCITISLGCAIFPQMFRSWFGQRAGQRNSRLLPT